MPPGTMRRRHGRSPEFAVDAAPDPFASTMTRSYDNTNAQRRKVRVGLVVAAFVVLAIVFSLRANAEWRRIERVPTGPYAGAATLVGDPELRGAGVAAVFRIDRWRYEAVFYGADAWRVRDRMQGESVLLRAERRRWESEGSRRKKVRHIAGRLDRVTLGGDWNLGSPLSRAINRLRRLIARGAASVPMPESSLLSGLVIGDDRAQPVMMRRAFRDSGLSHLTAVSGQNIAFVLAVFAPLLTRMRPGARLGSTLAVITSFTLMTRAEPSVLRAAAMSGVAAVVFAAGRHVGALATLVVSSCALLLADPFLGWSVGFWLSFAATLGLVVASGPCARWLVERGCPGLVAAPLAASFAAQAATLPVSLLVFGSITPFGLVANLLAVPVAGAVMLCGLPLCVVAGLSGGWVAVFVTAPLRVAVRYVWWVATVVSRLPG